MSQELLWEKKPFGGYKEFYLTTETMLPTKPPAEQWLLKMKGVRTTPFSKTLEAAITKGKGLGGLAATQQLLVTEYAKRTPFELMHYPITWPSGKLATGGLTRMLLGVGIATSLKAFAALTKKEHVTRRVVVPQRIFPRVESLVEMQPIHRHKQVMKTWHKQILKTGQVMQLTQVQKQVLGIQQVQKTVQLQKQLSKLAQMQLFYPKLLQKPARARVPRLRLPKVSKKRQKRKSMFGAWYFKRHRIATPKELVRNLMGLTKKHTNKKRKMASVVVM